MKKGKNTTWAATSSRQTIITASLPQSVQMRLYLWGVEHFLIKRENVEKRKPNSNGHIPAPL